MTVANQLVYLMIIYIFYNISWSEYQLRVFSYIYYLSFPVLFVLTFYAPGILNTNTIGSFAYFLSFFPLLYIVKYRRSHKLAIWVIIILTLTIVLATKTRSIQLSIIFGFITFVFWDYITSRAIFHKLYFLFIAGIGFFITIIYPNLNKYSFFKPLSEFILKYTGKSLFTGRNKIWMKLGEIIKGRIWLGHGSGVEPGTFLNTTLSAHNLYIQTGLQTGIIGILLLVLAMFFVWKSFLGARKDIRTALASCFFISILIHQVFEVTLTQNQFGIGLLQWMIIGFGLNGSLSIKNKNDSHNKLL